MTKTGPSTNPLCWWCNKALATVMTGPRKGELAFVIVKDKIGNEHKVHLSCKDETERAQRTLTAAPPEKEWSHGKD